MKPLHQGKLSEECKFSITEAFDQEIKDLARKASCTYAEMARELIWLGKTGKVFSEHVGNDRRALLQREGLVLADSSLVTGSPVDE